MPSPYLDKDMACTEAPAAGLQEVMIQNVGSYILEYSLKPYQPKSTIIENNFIYLDKLKCQPYQPFFQRWRTELGRDQIYRIDMLILFLASLMASHPRPSDDQLVGNCSWGFSWVWPWCIGDDTSTSGNMWAQNESSLPCYPCTRSATSCSDCGMLSTAAVTLLQQIL